MEQHQRELVSAKELEALGILSKAMAYKMARAGHIPSYAIGMERRGIRFRVEEILAALRRPAVPETAVRK
jgi:hypothetical protein